MVHSQREGEALWVIVEAHKQEFAVSAADVREIVPMPEITAIPQCGREHRGIINLRGRILPLIDIRKVFGWQSIPEELEAFLDLMRQREDDHRNWLKELEKSVVEGVRFGLARDPHQCAFGKWYDAYQPESPWIAALLRKFDAPHKKIHALAGSIEELAANAKGEEAWRLIEAARSGVLQKMVSLFHQLRELMRESVKELAMVIAAPQGAIAISIDRAVAVERIPADRIKEVKWDAGSTIRGGVVHRAAQRSSTGGLAMILETDLSGGRSGSALGLPGSEATANQ